MTDWCILRCAPSRTLRIARWIGDAGIEAWSPTEIQVKRDRGTGERSERMVPVMPTYVFARAEHLARLVEMSNAPEPGPLSFSVFRHEGRFPLVADQQLNHMRMIERQAALKARPVTFNRGQEIKIPDGPFQGLTGQVVETSKGEWTLVAFPGFTIPVKFASWTLSLAA